MRRRLAAGPPLPSLKYESSEFNLKGKQHGENVSNTIAQQYDLSEENISLAVTGNDTKINNIICLEII